VHSGHQPLRNQENREILDTIFTAGSKVICGLGVTTILIDVQSVTVCHESAMCNCFGIVRDYRLLPRST